MGLAKVLNFACAAFGVVMGSVCVQSCSFTLDFDGKQCAADRDCRERGGAFNNAECIDGFCEEGPECREDDECPAGPCVKGGCVDRWACLKNQPSPATATLTRVVPVTTIFGDPLPFVPVLLCNIVDTECTAPTASLMTDEAGLLTLELEPDFTGYLDIKLDEFFPQMNFLPKLLAEETTLLAVTLSPVQVIAGLAQAVGAAPDPERGHIVMSSVSCLGEAPDVALEAPRADEQAIPYYVLDGVPQANLNATTEDGSGGYLNFRTGNATVTIETSRGQELTTLSVIVRSSTISVIHFQPVMESMSN